MTSRPLFRLSKWITLLNGRRHEMALSAFMFVVLAHLLEHIVQVIQIWVLGWNVPDARGVLGQPFPWLMFVGTRGDRI
jgi:DMSO/TMAO reductase YedYZ heme-binding membrane subunit